jgi:DNA-binding CsgD family transcriptional regulator
MRFDPIRVVEACYAPEASKAAWLQSLAEALAPLGEGGSAWGQEFDASDPVRLHVSNCARVGPEPRWDAVLLPSWPAAPRALASALFSDRPPVDWFTRRAEALLRHDDAGLLDAWRMARGGEESVAVIAARAPSCGVAVAFAQRAGYRPPARLLHQLGQVAGHLASAVRLRGTLASATGDGPAADAVLDPCGRVHHAVGDARAPAARVALRDAVRLVERARGKLRDDDPEAALALWQGLVDGRWSLVDCVEADGRRWVLARRNVPGRRDPSALTPRERDVAAYAALGHANKWIAWKVGLAASTVADHLESARRKLRLASRGELIAFFGTPGAARGERA